MAEDGQIRDRSRTGRLGENPTVVEVGTGVGTVVRGLDQQRQGTERKPEPKDGDQNSSGLQGFWLLSCLYDPLKEEENLLLRIYFLMNFLKFGDVLTW